MTLPASVQLLALVMVGAAVGLLRWVEIKDPAARSQVPKLAGRGAVRRAAGRGRLARTLGSAAARPTRERPRGSRLPAGDLARGPLLQLGGGLHGGPRSAPLRQGPSPGGADGAGCPGAGAGDEHPHRTSSRSPHGTARPWARSPCSTRRGWRAAYRRPFAGRRSGAVRTRTWRWSARGPWPRGRRAARRTRTSGRPRPSRRCGACSTRPPSAAAPQRICTGGPCRRCTPGRR